MIFGCTKVSVIFGEPKSILVEAQKIAALNSFAQMLKVLPDDEACGKDLKPIRWVGTSTCVHRGGLDEKHTF